MEHDSESAIWQKVSSFRLVLCFKNRDSPAAKHVVKVFETLYSKHQKKISVAAQSVSLVQDHLLPMLIVQDKATNNVVCQVQNFIDQIGSGSNLTLEEAEKFLMARGVLQPDSDMRFNKFDQSVSAAERKIKETYYLCNSGSSFNPQAAPLEAAITELNKTALGEDYERKLMTHLDGSAESIEASNKLSGFESNAKFEYKKTILTVYRQVEDPFGTEVVGEQFDYE